MQINAQAAEHLVVLSSQAALWRAAQVLAWLGAVGLLILLVVEPRAGLSVMWDIVLPVAPVSMALVPGVWRNVCPLGTTSQIPRRLGVGLARPLTERWQIRLQTAGVGLLLAVVPLRHVSLDVDALATAATLAGAAGLALVAGFLFGGKSGWCSGLCPVHPVEKLYGHAPAITVKNAHCALCIRCTTICADSTRSMSPLVGKYHAWRTPAAWVLVGGFPGYVWGWFHVPDSAPLAWAFELPFGAMAVSLAAYALAMKTVPVTSRPLVSRCFAAAAITTYYWYRLPGLIGLGVFPGEGMLVDLSGVVSAGAVLPLQVAVAGFWAWWLVARNPARAWEARPAFA